MKLVYVPRINKKKIVKQFLIIRIGQFILLKIHLMIPKFLLVLGLIFGAVSQSCYPNFMVDQIFQNSVSLEFLPQEKKTSQSTKFYNHSFWGDAFTSKPSVAYCISEMEMTPTRQISYNLQYTVHTSAIEFRLYSKGIQWSMAKIHLWIYNRPDFFSKDFEFSATKGFPKKHLIETRLNLPSYFAAYKQTHHIPPIYQTYLTGLQSVSSGTSMHSVKLSDFISDDNVLRLQISSEYGNSIFSICILLVLVPIQTKELMSYEVDFSYRNFQESYELLNGRFHPVFNMLLGLKSIAFKSSESFSLKQEYDMQKSLMKISATNGKKTKSEVEFVELSLLSFGRLMSQVCTPCKDAFIELDTCRTQCPESFFSRSYYDSMGKQSGRICTKCLSQVNMEYSSDMKMCVCRKQHVMTDFGTRCNKKTGIKQPIKEINSDIDAKINLKQECPIKGMVFIDNKCQCQNDLDRVNDKCLARCGQNIKRDLKTGECLCDTGYETLGTSKACVKKCDENQVRDSSGACVCSSGYFLSDLSKKCEKKPQPKPLPSQPSSVTQQQSKQPNSVPKQKLKMTIDPQTPRYISSGIILDFFITPVIKRTDDEINKLFEVIFSDNKLAPPEIFLTQNENNLKEYRVFLFYRNNLPFKKFTVTIKIKDKNLGEDFLAILLDPLNVPATFSRRRDSNYLNFGK